MNLGLVTYNLARSWDLETIISRCQEAGLQAVQLRTEHRHGVEVTLSAAERAEVRSRFQDSDIQELSLGSTCEYHSLDAGEVRGQVELTKRFVDLAADIGAVGVKVRPNGLQEGRRGAQGEDPGADRARSPRVRTVRGGVPGLDLG